MCLCRSNAPRCSFRSNCQVKAILHDRRERREPSPPEGGEGMNGLTGERRKHFLTFLIYYYVFFYQKDLQYLKKSCTFDLLPKGSLRKYVRVLRDIRKVERKILAGLRPLFRARLRPPCASTRVHNRTRNNRIKFYFFSKKNIFICVCAIFVVPLQSQYVN